MTTRTKTINYLSETVFGFEGNGVHTSFLNTLEMMRSRNEFEIRANSWGPYAILHAHTFGPLYWLLRFIHQGKVVVHAHAIPETLVGQMKWTSLWLPLFRRYLLAYFNSADAVICMTAQLKETLLDMGVRSPIEVLELPISLSTFKAEKRLRDLGRRRLGLARHQKMVLGVGQLIPRKGIFDFLELARENPRVQFVWVGEIPFSVASDAYAKVKALLGSGLPNLKFPGAFPLESMSEFYNAADIFFFPSFQETFGLAIAEAAACGLPLLLRDLKTYRESFGRQYLAAHDLPGFSKALHRLLASGILRRQYGKRAQQSVQRYDARTASFKLARFYAGLLNAESPEPKRQLRPLPSGAAS
jgi:1,2-diacylglycerol-3-alpha-glucose alpha-1,2-galactosyltransferase